MKNYLKFLLFTFIYCVFGGLMYHSMHVEVETTLVSWLALSAMWVPGIELRS